MLHTIKIHLPPYLHDWFVHEMGGSEPIQLKRGSPMCYFVQKNLCVRRKEHYVPDENANTEIVIPKVWGLNPRSHRFITERGIELLHAQIRNDFKVSLWMFFNHNSRVQMLIKDRIDSFMEEHGISYDETNWLAVQQNWVRMRKIYSK